MQFVPVTITTEVMAAADGRPVAYIDATAVAVFACQEPDGTHVIEIHTRQDIPPGRLRLLLDGQALTPPTLRRKRALHDHHQPHPVYHVRSRRHHRC